MRFKGSGGGGPSNDRSNLFSTDAFEFVLGIAQGQIGGIVGDSPEEKLKHIYLDDTPLFNDAGEPNFEESELLIRLERGNPLTIAESADGQTPIRYFFGGTTTNQNVGAGLEYDTPLTRTTPAVPDGWDQLDVQIAVTALYRNTDDGSKRHAVTFTIEVTKIGGGYTKTETHTITGKTPQGGFAKSYKFELPTTALATDRYEIKITNNSDDSNEDNIATLVWRGYELVTRSSNVYTSFVAVDYTDPTLEYHPNTAMLHVVGVLGQQLSNIPNVNADYKGLLCRVPSNYDPIAKTYDESSAWDGTYAVDKFPTDNPFWIINELILNESFGVISYNPNVKINKYSVYDKAKYADGYGAFSGAKDLQNPLTLETGVARYTFNGILKDRSSGMEFINKILATTFSIVLENDDGELEILTDMPTVPVAFITAEMAIATSAENPFNYSYTSVNERINVVSTNYVDKENEYATQQLPEIRNQDAIDRHGLNVTEFTSLGTTSSWEAERKGIVFLVAAQTETESVQLLLPLSGIQFQVYDVVAIVNPLLGHGLSGRIISNGANALTVRDPLYFAESGSYKLTLQGITQDFEYIVSISAGQIGVGVTNFTLPTSYPATEELGDYPVVFIENTEGGTQQVGIPKLYRIVSIEPSEEAGIESFAVSAVEFNSQKHTEADLLNQATQAQYSFKRLPLLRKPENFLVVNESVSETLQGTKVSVWLSWDEQVDRPFGTVYEITVDYNGASEWKILTTAENYLEVPDLVFADYEFKIRSISGTSASSYATVGYSTSRVNAADLAAASAPITMSGVFENGGLTVNAEVRFAAGSSTSTPIPLLASGYLTAAIFSVYDDSEGNDTLLFTLTSPTPELKLSRSAFKARLQGTYLPSKLIVRVGFTDYFEARYPALPANDAELTLEPPVAAIANVTLAETTGNVGRYVITWNDNSPTYEFKLTTSTGNILLEQTLTTPEVKLDTLPVGEYTFTLQPRSLTLEYGGVFSQTLSVGALDTSTTAPIVVSENGVIIVTPPILTSRFESYTFRYNNSDDFGNALDFGSSNRFTLANVVKGQNYTIWYRLLTESNADTTFETVTVVGTEQSLFTWEVYATDNVGANISSTQLSSTWKGLSAGHTTETPDITDPTIYSWLPLSEGTKWTSGAFVPADTVGIDGSLHLDTSNGDVYQKTAGVWTLDGNLRGGDGDKWLRGLAEPPSDSLGTDGDNYLNTLTYTHYQKDSGTWVLVGSIKGLDAPTITFTTNLDGSVTINPNNGEPTHTIAAGLNGGVTPIYAADAVGTNPSLTQGLRTFVNFYEWVGNPPTSPPSGLSYVDLQGSAGVTSGMIAVYAEDASGTGASFVADELLSFVNFYEWTGTKPTLISELPTLIYVPFGGSEGPRGQSAYEIWLAEGNTGTEQDFLTYLRYSEQEEFDANIESLLEEGIKSAVTRAQFAGTDSVLQAETEFIQSELANPLGGTSAFATLFQSVKQSADGSASAITGLNTVILDPLTGVEATAGLLVLTTAKADGSAAAVTALNATVNGPEGSAAKAEAALTLSSTLDGEMGQLRAVALLEVDAGGNTAFVRLDASSSSEPTSIKFKAELVEFVDDNGVQKIAFDTTLGDYVFRGRGVFDKGLDVNYSGARLRVGYTGSLHGVSENIINGVCEDPSNTGDDTDNYTSLYMSPTSLRLHTTGALKLSGGGSAGGGTLIIENYFTFRDNSVVVERNLTVDGTISNLTGSHPAKNTPETTFTAGDLIAETNVEIVDAHNGVGDSSLCSTLLCKTVLGVFAHNNPDPLIKEVIVNGVGEGVMNVCGRNGDIVAGDLLTSSDLAGKAQRQNDDLVRSYTVGKSRKSVIFSTPDEVIQIPVIYMCGG